MLARLLGIKEAFYTVGGIRNYYNNYGNWYGNSFSLNADNPFDPTLPLPRVFLKE